MNVDVEKLKRQVAFWMDYHGIDEAERVMKCFRDPADWRRKGWSDVPESTVVVLYFEELNFINLANSYTQYMPNWDSALNKLLDSLGCWFEMDTSFSMLIYSNELEEEWEKNHPDKS